MTVSSSFLSLVGFSLVLLCISYNASEVTAFTSTPAAFVAHHHPDHHHMNIATNSRRCTTTITTGRSMRTITQRHAASYEVCEQVGYQTKCAKPLGIVFGENADPYFGVVVDDVSEGQNGGRAGLRVGDQLMAINGRVVVGNDLDSVLTLFQTLPARDVIDLVLFRGPVSTMYTILGNQMGEDEFVRDGDDDDDEEGEDEIVMDENYESPVVIEVKPKKSLSPADFFKAAAKVGKMLLEDNAPTTTPSEDGAPKEKKKNQGFFGIGAEAIQLDGNDANTLK